MGTPFEVVFLPGRLQLDNAPAETNRNCLRPIAGPQLFHNVSDMNLYRVLGDEEFLRDFPIPVPAGKFDKNLDFAVR